MFPSTEPLLLHFLAPLSADNAVSANRIAGWMGVLPFGADPAPNSQERSGQHLCRNTWWYEWCCASKKYTGILPTIDTFLTYVSSCRWTTKGGSPRLHGPWHRPRLRLTLQIHHTMWYVWLYVCTLFEFIDLYVWLLFFLSLSSKWLQECVLVPPGLSL